ncbi:hypothetical protein [Pseudomonas koreensis]|uniref:hypothetical protein n=1 Tax=Pseudomonas koreensis TaxID=198620 RepID=UPI001E40BDE9|nr:hypothetical protein [Pseudomonas koreensis]
MVSIELGQLVIQPASGKPVPPEWISTNRARLCREVLMSVGLDAFEYVGYSTGHYGKTRSAGITLQFVSILSGQSVYAVFNADLTRQRNTATGNAGALLPKGQFRIGKRSHFYKFWLSAGLQMPDRLQRFYKCMGKLSTVLMAGAVSNDRFDVQTLQPMTLSADEIRRAFSGHKEGTTKAQGRHKEGTKSGHKEIPTGHETRGLQPNQTTGDANYGNKVIREEGYKAFPYTHIDPPKPPQEQSVDEWLDAYSST